MVWKNSAASVQSSRRPGRGRPFRPALELLEDRYAPATFTVTGTDDGLGAITPTGPDTFTATTLRAAIDFANFNGDEADLIQFAPDLANGTINLTAEDSYLPTDLGHSAFVVRGNITILGFATESLTIDAGGLRRHFAVTPTGKLTLQYLTLRGGAAVGGNGGDFAMGGGGGGGAGLGGSIFNYQGLVILENCTLMYNNAQGGYGGSLENLFDGGGGGGGGSAAFSGGVSFNQSDDLGGGAGGAGMRGPGGNAGGQADGYKGGLGGANGQNQQAGPNQAGSNGGGGGGGSYSSNIFYQVVHSGAPGTKPNAFGFGGGGGGGAVLAGSGISTYGDAKGAAGGFGAGGGGAGYKKAANGGAGGFGGGGGGGTGSNNAGVSVFGGGTGGTYNGGTNNLALGGGGGGGAGLGGAIFSNGGFVSLTNCTLSGNSAQGGLGGSVAPQSGMTAGANGSGFGGAVFVLNGQFVSTLTTISGNTSTSGGNQVYLLSMGQGAVAGARLVNTVVGQAEASAAADVFFQALNGAKLPKVTGAKNFIGNPGNFPRSALVGTGDPMLLPLADNGGPTPTMLPQVGSPLVNAGQNQTRWEPLSLTDQRGQPRLQNAFVDIGSVEVDWSQPPVLRDLFVDGGSVLSFTRLNVVFSGPVTVTPGAFRLTRGGSQANVPIRTEEVTANGFTFVRLIVGSRGPLRGSFTLTLDGSRLLDENGDPLEALTGVRQFVV